MADTNELDAFLGAGSEPASAPEPQQAPPPEPPEQDAPDEDEGDAAEPDQGDDAPPEPRPGERTVPLAALEKQRKNHQERAARLEGELAEVRRQFEEVKRAQQQPPQQYQPPQPPQQQYIPNPAHDPQGFFQWQQEQLATATINTQLNLSEAQAREKHGAEAVEAALAEFKPAMEANPNLRQQLYQQAHPYEWMMKQVEAIRLQREIGTDPKGWREKLIAEERAKWEAEYTGTAPPAAPVSPAARLNPSLATARSAAPRSNGAWSGPTPLSDLFPNR